MEINTHGAATSAGTYHRAKTIYRFVVLLKRAVLRSSIEIVGQQRGNAGAIILRRALTGLDAEAAVDGRVAGPGLCEHDDSVGQGSADKAVGSARFDTIAEIPWAFAVSYTHLRAHETDSYLVCRL